MAEVSPTSVVRLPLLAPEEVEHYRWLIHGLLDGAWRLASRECPETSTVPEAVDHARELVDELLARIPAEVGQ